MMSISRATSQKYGRRQRQVAGHLDGEQPEAAVPQGGLAQVGPQILRHDHRGGSSAKLSTRARNAGRPSSKASLGGHVEEIVHARLRAHHQGLHRDRPSIREAANHRVGRLAPAHGGRAVLQHVAPGEAEGQVAREHVERAQRTRGRSQVASTSMPPGRASPRSARSARWPAPPASRRAAASRGSPSPSRTSRSRCAPSPSRSPRAGGVRAGARARRVAGHVSLLVRAV